MNKKMVAIILGVSCLTTGSSANALTLVERQRVLPIVKAEEEFINLTSTKNEKLSYEEAFYSVELAEELKHSVVEKVYNKVVSEYPSAKIECIELAYDVASTRLAEPFTMKDFFNVFIMNVVIMELESGFNQNTIGNNPTTKDYGIMQINETTKDMLEDALDRKLNIENSLYDNIDAGSYIIFTCYEKALKKHPTDSLWWTYVYYNRGLYVENSDSWKGGKSFNQANIRSNKFIETYNKYYTCI